MTLFAFWYDKSQAIRGKRRIPEFNLLALAFLGGTPSAFLGRQLFRHKTRKEPFSTILQIILMVQIGAAIGFFVL